MKNCLPWKRLHAGAGEQYEEEGAAERKCYRITTTPFPISFHCSGEGDRRVRSEAEFGKKGGWREGGFSFAFIYHYPTPLLTVNKLN